jgi:hypothetical protein
VLRLDIGRRPRRDPPEHERVRGQAPLCSLVLLPLASLASVGGVGQPLVHLAYPLLVMLPLLAGRHVAHTVLDLLLRVGAALARSGEHVQITRVELVAAQTRERARHLAVA